MIDWQRVEELRDDVGPEDFEDVVDLFLEEVAEVVDRLAASPDKSNIEDDLHFLKGSALNLGFNALGEICAEGERLAHSGSSGDVDVAALIQVYETSIAAFKARLRQDKAA